MFELEIEREKKKCAEAIVLRGERFTTLQSICGIEALHPFYTTFFVAHADWWIYELNLERSGDTRFDFTDSAVLPVLKETDNLLRQTVRFSHDELVATIDIAVKVRLNFLCRPRTTLTWFIFRGEPTKPINEIWLRLNYFSEYSYLAEGFRQWAQANYAVHPSHDLLSVVEFDTLIADIDNATILELSPHEFTDLLEPIYEFFYQSGKAHENHAVPIEALIIFLDDKGVDLIAKELERMYYDEHIDRLTRNDFLEVVTRIVSELEGSDSSIITEIINKENEISSSFNAESPENDELDIQGLGIEILTVQPASVSEKKEERLDELEATDSAFLGLVHTFSVHNDYISVENGGSAELYMAEFVGTSEKVVSEEVTEEAIEPSIELLNEISENHISESVDESSVFSSEEMIEKEILKDEISEEIKNDSVSDIILGSIEEENEVVGDENKVVEGESTQGNDEIASEVNEIIDEYETVLPKVNEDIESTEGENIAEESADRIIAEVVTDIVNDKEDVAIENQDVYSLTEHHSRGYIPSLSSKIDAAKKESLIKKMFHKDNELYETFVKEIDKTYSWKEAAAAIDRFYVRHNIKDSGALAKELRTIIQKRYVR